MWALVLLRGWQALGETGVIPPGADASDLSGTGLIQKHVMNDQEIAKRMLKRDVARVGESASKRNWSNWLAPSRRPQHGLEDFIAFTDSGDDWLWEPVKEELVRLAAGGKRIKIVVSAPRFNDKSDTRAIKQLAKVSGITVMQLPERPPVDLRLVNGRHLHIAYHSKREDPQFKRPCWRSREEGARPKEIDEAVAFIRSTEGNQTPLAA